MRGTPDGRSCFGPACVPHLTSQAHLRENRWLYVDGPQGTGKSSTVYMLALQLLAAGENVVYVVRLRLCCRRRMR